MITRRQFHRAGIGALAVASSAPVKAAVQPWDRRWIVDSGVHVWKAATPDRPWVPGATAHLPQPMTIERLMPMMDDAGVDRVVLIPPALEGLRTDYTLEAALAYPRRFGTTVRPNFQDPGDELRLRLMACVPACLAWRHSFSGASGAWLTDGTADWFWPVAEKIGKPVMFLAAGQTVRFGPIAERYPGLPLIADHMGVSLADVKSGRMEQRISETVALARYPNMSVKLSAAPLYSRESYPWRDMNTHLKRLVDAFGPERCHWGTDITNSKTRTAMFSTMKQRVTHFTQELPFLSESDKDWIMGKSLMMKLNWK